MVTTLESANSPLFIASMGDEVWVAHHGYPRIDVFGAATHVLVDQIDTTNNNPSDSYFMIEVGSDIWVMSLTDGQLGRYLGSSGDFESLSSSEGEFGYMALVGDQVWVAHWRPNRGGTSVEILDAVDGSHVGSIELTIEPEIISTVGQEVWISTDRDELMVFDATTRELLRTIEKPGMSVKNNDFVIPVGTDVWVSTEDGVHIIDSATGETRQTLDIDGSWIMTQVGNSVFVGNSTHPEVLVVDIASRSIIQTIELPSPPAALSLVGDSVWVTLPSSDQVVVLAAQG